MKLRQLVVISKGDILENSGKQCLQIISYARNKSDINATEDKNADSEEYLAYKHEKRC